MHFFHVFSQQNIPYYRIHNREIAVMFEFFCENVFSFFHYSDDKLFFVHFNKNLVILRLFYIYIFCFNFFSTNIITIYFVDIYTYPFLNAIYRINFIDNLCFLKYISQVRIFFGQNIHISRKRQCTV